MLAKKESAAQALPGPHAPSKRHVETRCAEVHYLVRQRKTHGKVRIAELEVTDPAAQPRSAEGYGGVDRQHLVVLLVTCREGVGHVVEGGTDCGKQIGQASCRENGGQD